MRRLWMGVVLLVVAAFGFGVGAVIWPGGGSPKAAAQDEDGLFFVETNERIVAMTFDDGPDPRYTPKVLDLLEKHGDHATFFEIGRNALDHPELSHALLDAGNEIGNHTFDHPDLELLSAAAVQDEIQRGEDALRQVGLPPPKYFRPPKGDTDNIVSVVAKADRYDTVFWGLCVEHFVDHRPDINGGVEDLLGRVRPGTIILAHDGGIPDRTKTMEALPFLFDGLQKRGYRVVTVSELVKNAKEVNL